MRAVEEAVDRILAIESADEALDELYGTVDDWLRRGGCADAVAELLGLLADSGAAISLLVGALSITNAPRDEWTDELRVARDRVVAAIRRREPDRWPALVGGLENESPDPGDLFERLERLICGRAAL